MTIAEVSKKYDITPDTLRYYERIGLLTNITRNQNGIRNYDDNVTFANYSGNLYAE